MPARPIIVLCILVGLFVFYFCYENIKNKNNDSDDNNDYRDNSTENDFDN